MTLQASERVIGEVDLPEASIRALARRHGLAYSRASRLPSVGIINTVVALDDAFVLRVPRDHPAHIAQLRREVIAIPLARAAGVHAPELIAFDDTLDLLPVPYAILEWAPGVDVESARVQPADVPELWHELGRELGRLHGAVDPTRWPAAHDAAAAADVTLEEPGVDRLSALIEARVDDGWFSSLEGCWLEAWVTRLEQEAGGAMAAVATHGDVQLSNVLMHPGTQQFSSLLDWGCAACRDPAYDFMPMPLAAVPHLLGGYREVAPGIQDETTEARILRVRLNTLLSVLPRGPAPNTGWGERPIAWLIDLLRFFEDPPSPAWRRLAPKAPATAAAPADKRQRDKLG